MPPVEEIRSITSDFGGSFDSVEFHAQVVASSITTNFIGINVNGDVVKAWFDAALSGAELTTFNGLVTAHDGTPHRPRIETIPTYCYGRNATFTTSQKLQSPGNANGDGFCMPAAGSIKRITYNLNSANESQAGTVDLTLLKDGSSFITGNDIAISGNDQYVGCFEWDRGVKTFAQNECIVPEVVFDGAQFIGGIFWVWVTLEVWLDN